MRPMHRKIYTQVSFIKVNQTEFSAKMLTYLAYTAELLPRGLTYFNTIFLVYYNYIYFRIIFYIFFIILHKVNMSILCKKVELKALPSPPI